MVDCAFIFPGQGAQYVGMGKALYEKAPYGKIFENANRILGYDLAQICFEGPSEKLTQTQYSQPAIFVTSVAVLKFLQESGQNPYRPKAACGLSLGEYTALVASGVLSFEDALRAVHERGRLMEQASEVTPGTLLAIFGLPLEKVEELCRASGTEIANLNCPGQIVVSGRLGDIGKVSEAAKEAGAKKTFRLEVSGPFHSRFMKEAGTALEKVLQGLHFETPQIPFMSNVTARFEGDIVQIRRNLVRQISETVLWEQSIRFLAAQRIRQFVEIGPGKVLSGLNRKIDPSLETHHIESPEEIGVR
ncbi:MAG: ACP S-malonyltransferase [Candidatus Omnitrophota bacterium]